jgi:hypothetical protein
MFAFTPPHVTVSSGTPSTSSTVGHLRTLSVWNAPCQCFSTIGLSTDPLYNAVHTFVPQEAGRDRRDGGVEELS